MTTETRTIPSALILMLADHVEMRKAPKLRGDYAAVNTKIAALEAEVYSLRLSQVLIRLELIPKALQERFMDLAKAIHFGTLEGPDREVPIGELAHRLAAS
jgi:hypothetical protein